MGQNPAVPHHTRYMSLLRLGTLAGGNAIPAIGSTRSFVAVSGTYGRHHDWTIDSASNSVTMIRTRQPIPR